MLGSDDVNILNILKILYDLLALVERMNIKIALHKHGMTSVPDNAFGFVEDSGEAVDVKILLGELIG